MMEKKSTKILVRLIAVALIAVMLMSGLTAFADVDNGRIENAKDMAELVYKGYNKGAQGPISITQGKLYYKNSRNYQDVYVVALSGTEVATEACLNQSTFILTDLFAGFNLDNAYYHNVVQAICQLDEGSKLILAGHSLGGMVAQQVASDPTIKAKYDVLYTVTFGSPLLSVGRREGKTVRLGDWTDVVPYLSINTLATPIQTLVGLTRAHGTYLNPISSHMKSYARCNVWKKYDALGNYKGTASAKGYWVQLDRGTQRFYPSPAFDISCFKGF